MLSCVFVISFSSVTAGEIHCNSLPVQHLVLDVVWVYVLVHASLKDFQIKDDRKIVPIASILETKASK